MSLAIDLSERKARNLLVLQKKDSSVTDIIDSAAHVALYKFDQVESKWNRFGVEGAAFVTLNSRAPLHKFILLNKQGPDDYILDLSTANKIKNQAPYLMLQYKQRGEQVIMGMWFHGDAERDRLMTTLSNAMGKARSSDGVDPIAAINNSNKTKKSTKASTAQPGAATPSTSSGRSDSIGTGTVPTASDVSAASKAPTQATGADLLKALTLSSKSPGKTPNGSKNATPTPKKKKAGNKSKADSENVEGELMTDGAIATKVLRTQKIGGSTLVSGEATPAAMEMLTSKSKSPARTVSREKDRNGRPLVERDLVPYFADGDVVDVQKAATNNVEEKDASFYDASKKTSFGRELVPFFPIMEDESADVNVVHETIYEKKPASLSSAKRISAADMFSKKQPARSENTSTSTSVISASPPNDGNRLMLKLGALAGCQTQLGGNGGTPSANSAITTAEGSNHNGGNEKGNALMSILRSSAKPQTAPSSASASASEVVVLGQVAAAQPLLKQAGPSPTKMPLPVPPPAPAPALAPTPAPAAATRISSTPSKPVLVSVPAPSPASVSQKPTTASTPAAARSLLSVSDLLGASRKK
jgi:hypothetical protein